MTRCKANGSSRLWMIGIIVSAVFFLCSSGVFAFWQITGRTTNILTMNAYRTEIKEKYTIPDPVYPNTSVEKTVHIANTGDTDCYVRVCVTPVFGERRPDGRFIKDESLDTEVITIDYNETYWVRHGDFWYYKEILRAGSETKEPLFESFNVSALAGNAYRGKDAEIEVTMESVQAQGEGFSLWPVTREELGIEIGKPDDLLLEDTSLVTYLGSEHGFAFDGLGSDLFTNFKNLLPGCARTQQIRIRNASEQSTAFSLHAEPSRQDKMSERELVLVQKLLEQYAQIKIRQGDTVLYDGPVNGISDTDSGQSMGVQSPLVLGMLRPEETSDLIVSLSLSPEMDIEYRELTGKVDWIFCAQGQSEDAAAVPKTGDFTPIGELMLLCAGSVLLLLALQIHRKGRSYGKV